MISINIHKNAALSSREITKTQHDGKSSAGSPFQIWTSGGGKFSVTVARKAQNGGNEATFRRYNLSEFDLTKIPRGDTKTANRAWLFLAVLRFWSPNRLEKGYER